MYYIYSIKDNFRLLPEYFTMNINDAAAALLQKKYEGQVDKDMGIILSVNNVRNISDGYIMPGDPSTHHDVEFDLLTYAPYVDEVVAGEVTEIAEFGAFVRIGPMDGLVHVSQILNEFLSFDRKAQAFVSKKSGKNLKKGDLVYAKISTVSMKSSVKDSKIALTMKPEGLGKLEWLSRGSSGVQKEKPKGKSHAKK
ncbi:MAG: DNA-directed RNA polymerase [Candidatus Marsarchaeota archaeon]|nr:DNA-directed RNA polymerase [Candidatus Marsarchaeota archaeon]MCL5418336.1 DNA-directed RNA polymerase [Candidatus Marsarchaeota archaeon]